MPRSIITLPNRQPSSPAWQAALAFAAGSVFIQNSIVKSPPTSAGTCGSTGTFTRSTSPLLVPWNRSAKPAALLPVWAPAVAVVPAAAAVRSAALVPLPVVTVAEDGLVGLSVHAVAQSPRPTSTTV